MIIETRKRRQNLIKLHVNQIIFPIFFFTITALVSICGCSDAPVEEDNQDKQIPDLKDMVFIPAGEFLMGSLESEGAFDESPQHRVYLDAYYIDKYEVTSEQFKEFVESTGYVTDAERKGYGEVWNPKETWPPWQLQDFNGVSWRRPNYWLDTKSYPNRPHPIVWENYSVVNYPVVQVSWNDAQMYAKWVGKRLPTEAEWEKAARGTDSSSKFWPWGNVFNVDIGGVTIHANIAGDYLLPVGSFPMGVSPYGVHNMAGNAQEWTSDWYAADYYAGSSRNNPKGPLSGVARVLRGGSWRHQKSLHVLNAHREYRTPDYNSNFVGFRCVWNQ